MSDPVSPETSSRLAALRYKAANGTYTMEDMREAVTLLRADRKSAIATSAAKRTAKAKKAIPDADTLMKDLGL